VSALLEAEEGAISLAGSLIEAAFGRGYRVGLVVLGVSCGWYAPHASPLHRTRLMETLAELDCDRIGGSALPGGFRPTVVVSSGEGRGWSGRGGVRVLRSSDLASYVVGEALR
jgi:uncharacterized protein (DUF58 family)